MGHQAIVVTTGPGRLLGPGVSSIRIPLIRHRPSSLRRWAQRSGPGSAPFLHSARAF